MNRQHRNRANGTYRIYYAPRRGITFRPIQLLICIVAVSMAITSLIIAMIVISNSSNAATPVFIENTPHYITGPVMIPTPSTTEVEGGPVKSSDDPIVPVPLTMASEADPITPAVIPEPDTAELTARDLITEMMGADTIDLGDNMLVRCELPSVFYPGIDFSTFQPYMDYKKVTDKTSPSYKVTHSQSAYTDDLGMRRYKVTSDQVSIDGKDDYVVALATYYKPKGEAGLRYVIITSTGMYTVITGDEKDDRETDPHNMYSYHGEYAGVIEWLVDTSKLERTMKVMGTIAAGPIEELQGEILYIYRIE